MHADEALLRRISAGDTVAFEEFYARHRDRVYRRLLGMLRSADAAEDVVQETFLRIWQRAEQWDSRGSCQGWMFRIATNLALNLLRTQRRHREIPLDMPDLHVDDEDQLPGWMVDAASAGPEAICLQSDRMDQQQRLVESLSEDKREVIRLVVEQEMEIRDAAATLGIPEGTVKSRLHYARKHLSRAWQQLTEEEL